MEYNHRSQSATMFSGLTSNSNARHDDDDDEQHKHRFKEMDFFQGSSTCFKGTSKEDSSVKADNNGIRDDSADNGLKLQIDTGLRLQMAPSADFVEKSMVDDDEVGVLKSHNHGIQDTMLELVALKEEIARKNIENERLKSRLREVANKYETLRTEYLTLVRQHQLDQNNASKIHPTKTLNDDEAMNPRTRHQMGEFLGSRQTTINIDDDEEDQRRSDPNLGDTIGNHRDGEHLIKRLKREDHNAKVGKNLTPLNMQRVGAVGMAPATADIEESHEVTMRRARVSVRARSDANMVHVETLSTPLLLNS